MFKLCAQANLPPPEFRQSGGQFIQTLNRDWMTDKLLAGLQLNERQRKALQIARSAGRITSADLQNATHISRATAFRELNELVAKNVLVRRGAKRGTHYVLVKPKAKI
jgi:ATP-dependent DNA helicase RecG